MLINEAVPHGRRDRQAAVDAAHRLRAVRKQVERIRATIPTPEAPTNGWSAATTPRRVSSGAEIGLRTARLAPTACRSATRPSSSQPQAPRVGGPDRAPRIRACQLRALRAHEVDLTAYGPPREKYPSGRARCLSAPDRKHDHGGRDWIFASRRRPDETALGETRPDDQTDFRADECHYR